MNPSKAIGQFPLSLNSPLSDDGFLFYCRRRPTVESSDSFTSLSSARVRDVGMPKSLFSDVTSRPVPRVATPAPPADYRREQPNRTAPVQCRWQAFPCGMLLTDSTPYGTIRHLEYYHAVETWTLWGERARATCLWSDPDSSCNVKMFCDWLGRHIDRVHLRRLPRQCPLCKCILWTKRGLKYHVENACRRRGQIRFK